MLLQVGYSVVHGLSSTERFLTKLPKRERQDLGRRGKNTVGYSYSRKEKDLTKATRDIQKFCDIRFNILLIWIQLVPVASVCSKYIRLQTIVYVARRKKYSSQL
ncbi:hypothetical protein JTB14_036053 [Gonioctena quinquepunctata]|nr:hypothetical protein JTB14_036053 [Gonioctena quinquepunctata]